METVKKSVPNENDLNNKINQSNNRMYQRVEREPKAFETIIKEQMAMIEDCKPDALKSIDDEIFKGITISGHMDDPQP